MVSSLATFYIQLRILLVLILKTQSFIETLLIKHMYIRIHLIDL